MVSNDKSVDVSAGSAKDREQNVKFSYNEELILKLRVVHRSDIRDRVQYDLYVNERKLLKHYPDGKLWVSGLVKDELATLGLVVEQTCNCNATWYYLVDAVMGNRVLNITKYLHIRKKAEEYEAAIKRCRDEQSEIEHWLEKNGIFSSSRSVKMERYINLRTTIKTIEHDLGQLEKKELRSTGWLLSFDWVLNDRTPEQVKALSIDKILEGFNTVISDPHKIDRLEVVSFVEDGKTVVKFQIREGQTLRDDVIVEFYDFAFSSEEATRRVKGLRGREGILSAYATAERYYESTEEFYKIWVQIPSESRVHIKGMTYAQACERWEHKFNGNGYLCPVTKRVVNQCYGRPELGGFREDGVFLVVSPNSCKYCGDPDFTVARDLHRINEQRKREVEGKKRKTRISKAKRKGSRIICPTDNCTDCSYLSTCTKDQNEFNAEEYANYLKSLHCPICGFAMALNTDGDDVCLDCGHVVKRGVEE